MSEFVDTPMSKEFVKDDCEGGPGGYNGEKDGAFGSYPRTPSPNAKREKTYDGSVKKPSGEHDQF